MMAMTPAERTLARVGGDTAEFLAAIGIEILPGPVVVIADAIADPPYVHHSSVPVALTAYAIASPTFARGRFPKTRLVDVVAARPRMDGREALALAAVCGVKIEGDAVSAFVAHLHHIVARYELGALFGRCETRAACQGIDLRPRGVDWRTDQVDPVAMSDWRAAFKALTLERQMLAATILWLYRGGPDTVGGRPGHWLGRMRVNWHAADAIATLRDAGSGRARPRGGSSTDEHGRPAGMLADWGNLMALYSGW